MEMHITINFKLVFYNVYVCVFVLSHAQLFATPGTVAHSKLCRWNFPGKNTGVGCYFLGDLPAKNLHVSRAGLVPALLQSCAVVFQYNAGRPYR